MLIYWSKAQKKGQTAGMEAFQSHHRSLHLIDEFFLYCCRVSAGLKEKMLADIFKVSLSTVSRIIITWANYLYLILGSLPIWMSRQDVNSTMPEKFRQFCPEVRVIIDCAEIRCQNPSSLTLQSEVPSPIKSCQNCQGSLTCWSQGMLAWLTKDSPSKACWQSEGPNSSCHLLKQQLSSAKKMQREHKP